MTCDRCGKTIESKDGEYRYWDDRLIFACSECAKKLDDEILKQKKVCDAVDSKKEEAEKLLNKNRDQLEKFLKDAENLLKKVPGVGNLLGDIPLLVSLVKNYIEGKYREIPQNVIVAVVAAILYFISPVDLIPDVIPGVGFVDDAAVVGFCIKMIHDDLERFKAWRDKAGIEA